MQSDPTISGHGILNDFLNMSLSQNENFNFIDHAKISLGEMASYFQSQRLTDVTLVAGDKRIAAHRLVLSVSSETFAAMFTNKSGESAQDEIELMKVDGDALLALVQYCYTGRIELKKENLKTLLATANLLQLNLVVEACCQSLMKKLHPSNCLGVRMLADTHRCAQLFTVAHAYAMKHFLEIIKNQEYLSLTAEEMANLLKSEDLTILSEKTVFDALMSWFLHDSVKRFEATKNLFNHGGSSLLSPTLIAELPHIQRSELYKDQMAVQNLVQALLHHPSLELRPVLQAHHGRQQQATDDVLLAIGGTGTTSIDAFFLRDNAWKKLTNMTGKRTGFGATIWRKQLLVIGGRLNGKETNTVECFDFSNSSWYSLPPMNMPRTGLGVTVLEESVYAVGGYDGSSFLSTVEKWNLVTHQWNYVAPMSTERSNFGVAVLNNKLYAVGGSNKVSLNTVECYDSQTNEWTFRAPLSRWCIRVDAAVSNGYLYVLGGFCSVDNLGSVERYDSATNTWSTVARMPVARYDVGVCELGNRLFAVGGSKFRNRYMTLVQAYDPVSNEWKEFPSLEVGRYGLRVVAMPSINKVNGV